MIILISDSAYADFIAIKEYYLKQGVSHIGEQFVSSIIEHIETLPENSNSGKKVPEFNTNKIRELIHNPFRLIYLREDKSIHIIKIWRTEKLLKLPELRMSR